MTSRRQFLRVLAATLPGAATYSLLHAAPGAPPVPQRIWLPLVSHAVSPGDALILGPASGTMRQAFDWLTARTVTYTAVDVARIVRAYAKIGTAVGIDWFLALAQLAHETGNLTSWWAQVPRRNPAGIGVSGATREGSPDVSPGAEWAWNGQRWAAGWSFPSWADHAAPTHLGLLLAYALRDEHANDAQMTLIAQTVGQRRLGALRGSAVTFAGLNGVWAVPGTVYGQRIVEIGKQMRVQSPDR